MQILPVTLISLSAAIGSLGAISYKLVRTPDVNHDLTKPYSWNRVTDAPDFIKSLW